MRQAARRSVLRRLVTGLVLTATALAAVPARAEAAAPRGDLPGWHQVFRETFTRDLARGSFPGPYAGRWGSYDGFADSSGGGDYNSDIISAHDGVLDLYLHGKGGRPQVAAPVPLVGGKWGGQTYGRYSVRMKADPLPGYGVSFLLWSDRNRWSDGEINFPESTLDGTVAGFNHCPGKPTSNCHWYFGAAHLDDWHTYTIEWTPGRVRFLLDGRVVSTTTTHVPKASLHWVMQVETPNPSRAAAHSGHVLIDWATVYRRA